MHWRRRRRLHSIALLHYCSRVSMEYNLMQFQDEREKFGQQSECVLRITKPSLKVRIEFAKNAEPEVNRNKNISHWENHETNFYLHQYQSFQVVTSSSVFRLFWTLTKIKIYAAWERHYTCYEKNNLVLNTEHWYLNTNTHPWILNTEYWNLNTSTHHWLWILNTDT